MSTLDAEPNDANGSGEMGDGPKGYESLGSPEKVNNLVPAGDYYEGKLGDIAGNPLLQDAVQVRAANVGDRIWLGEDEPATPGNHFPATEANARDAMATAINLANKYMQKPTDYGSQTLSDLQIGKDFDNALRYEVLQLFGCNGGAWPEPNELRPETYRTTVYETSLPGYVLKGARHNRSGKIKNDGSDYEKFSLHEA